MTRTPLEEWTGAFGREYTDRNVVDWRKRVAGFDAILDGLDVASVLEVGCNRGHNLHALSYLDKDVTGVEPGSYARHQAIADGLVVLPGSVYSMPFDHDQFDLAFTSGVLIHVPPSLLDKALQEIVRVSRRYVLAIEYHADTDTEMPYRGRDGLMWNRDYGAHYERLGLSVVRSELLDAAFDMARFWLLEKRP